MQSAKFLTHSLKAAKGLVTFSLNEPNPRRTFVVMEDILSTEHKCACVHKCVYMCACGWVGRVGMPLFNPPFLILKVRHPAVTGVYCIVRDSRSVCSNDFKCVHVLCTDGVSILL